MILADKIIALRKKSGWSQEELAEKMNVTRQSVSKWEGAQSVPDLEKILLLSQLFGVSTDYLLKDELGEPEYANTADEPDLRRVTMEEANEFLRVSAFAAKRIALATFMCIISPICLMLLAAAQDTRALDISENMAAGVGLIVMFLLVAAAVMIFISSGAKTAQYEYLEKESFETEYGVTGMVKERQKEYRETHTRGNVLGTCLCILSVIPLFAMLFLQENDLAYVAGVCVMLAVIGIGVIFFILVGMPWSGMQKLLQEGDYTKQKKQVSERTGAISTIYWLVVVAGFLAYSFLTDDWENSWIVWPVAGVLYAAVMIACGAWNKKQK